ncbi:MAG TPA: NUDIX hydrolase [Phycisphaerales bacterium]|nr:NUDIX hydrolase [Phycisphaerales bacterium]HCD34226.1 NUDIX hydrolase [Phycisphaerales bacterium]|tara:strand:- start:359 stop:898 length:540 start_codon:yes stop_codon:yes gene_type:complete
MTQRKIEQMGQKVFTGKRFDVVSMDLPNRNANSGTHRKDMVLHPGAAVILPMIDEDHVVMIQNERPIEDVPLWELPAGTLEPPEEPHVTAGRELIEEAGYQAGEIKLINSFYASPGICTEMMHCYLATNLTAVGQQLEPNEKITVKVLPMNEAMEMVRDGRIIDGKTIATLLYYQTFCR